MCRKVKVIITGLVKISVSLVVLEASVVPIRIIIKLLELLA